MFYTLSEVFMGKKMEKKVGSVRAKDKEGKVYTLIVFQEFFDQTALGDATEQWLPGTKWYQTEDGNPVNVTGEGKFEIVGSGVELTLIPE
jgi:hypothetical protein